MDLSDLRRDFGNNSKQMASWPDNPFLLFQKWLEEAIHAGIPEANAMVLATSGADGKPSSRVVLLKEYSEAEGFIFYTNYASRKAKDLTINPYASLHFFWREKEQQIMIEGRVEKTSPEKSSDYFDSRPINSKISAIISPQSKVINSLAELKKQREELLARPNSIKRPPYWGGYKLVANKFEFWQGGQYRLHRRVIYYYETGNWKSTKLAP